MLDLATAVSSERAADQRVVRPDHLDSPGIAQTCRHLRRPDDVREQDRPQAGIQVDAPGRLLRRGVGNATEEGLDG